MFGKRKEQLMSQEPKEPSQEKAEKPSTPASNRPPKKEVDLFPPIAERNLTAPSVSASSGGRLATQISMFAPVSFEEALDVVEALRARNATTISLDKLKKTDSNRLVDFVAGASAALDGDFHKMTENVYVFCPANIRIVNSSKPASTSASATGSLTRALANTSNGSSFSLDTLFPEISQANPTASNGFSTPFWARQ